MRAGREPAEDVVRALKRACVDVGLVVEKTYARLNPGRTARTIMVSASPPSWPHDEIPMVSLITSVTVGGDVASIQVFCQGTDDDPLRSVFTAPVLRDCDAALEDAAETLETVLLDRVCVGQLLADGQEPPFFIGSWMWAVPSLALD